MLKFRPLPVVLEALLKKESRQQMRDGARELNALAQSAVGGNASLAAVFIGQVAIPFINHGVRTRTTLCFEPEFEKLVSRWKALKP